jgi:hypothetical protein
MRYGESLNKMYLGTVIRKQELEEGERNAFAKISPTMLRLISQSM